ncbi:MAG: nicotinate (nicotinamide) nucleotide adenylyltransferase [Bacteroidota bacterium]
MRKRKTQIGIFGGSFDPPHLGHLIVAEYLCGAAELDKVIFVPAFQPPHKLGNYSATAAQRIAMIRLAVRGNAMLAVSDYEIQRRGISYTVDTVEEFSRQYPDAELSLILGLDSFHEFATWKTPEKIVLTVRLLVYPRSGYDSPSGNPFFQHAEFVSAPLVDISSGMIRRRVSSGKSIRYFVPEPVERFILSHHLYAGGGAKRQKMKREIPR